MRENVTGARDALERSAAAALDPGSAMVLQALAACYDRLGDPARARALFARAQSLSGGEFGG